MFDLLFVVFPAVRGATTQEHQEGQNRSLLAFLFDSSHQRSVGFGFFSCFLIQKSFTFMFLSHKARRVFSHLRPHAEEFKSYFIILANKESA